MTNKRSRHIGVALLIAALQSALPMGDAVAQNGTMERRTLTFSGSATASMTFGVQSLLVDPANPPSTIIQLEFGKDGFGSVNDPALGTGVNFTLTRTSAAGGSLTFPITSLPSGSTTISGKEITVSRTDPVATPGLLTLSIVHTASTAAAETFTLAISGLPTPSPAIRGIASLGGASTGFTSLTPVGVCGAASAPSVCPIGQACREPCRFIPIKPFRIYYEVIKWPFPLPDPDPICPVCGNAWRQKFDEARFDRSMVVFVPTPEQRAALARDKTKAGLFTVSGGELVGGMMETSNGKIMQIVQHPKGKSPLISIDVPGAMPEEPAVRPNRDGSSRSALFGLGGLVIGALAGVAFGRGTRPDNQRPT